MKSHVQILLISILLISCHNKSKTTSSISDSATLAHRTDEDAGISDEMQARMEKMRSLTPMPAEKIKLMFPGQIDSLKLTDYSGLNNEGYETGEATYASDDGKKIYVTILDCAGDAGVGRFNLMYVAYLGDNWKRDEGYRKIINYRGDKAIESYEKEDDRYTLLFPSNDRLLVKIEGEKTGVDELKQAARQLQLSRIERE